MEKNAEIVINILESMYFLKTLTSEESGQPLIYMSTRMKDVNFAFVRKTLIQEQVRFLAYGRKRYLEKNHFLGVIVPEKEKGFFYKKDFIQNIDEFLKNLPLAFFTVHPEVVAISIIRSIP